MALLARFLFIGVSLLWLEAGFSAPAGADETLQLHEQEIEAGLIYNFLKYIDWPDDTGRAAAPMSVCIFGDDPFKGYLQPMVGRTVNRRRIDVRNVHDLSAISDCDLLFVNASEKSRWPQLEKSLAGKTILTVSDFDDFASSGGMIEFGRTDDHIRVSLNLDAVTAARLRVEDRLLKLVTVLAPEQGR